MNICIAGAGAIGCTLAARLSESGQNVKVLARGATLETLKSTGIRLTDIDGEHTVKVFASDSAEEIGPQDLIFICCKAPALPAMLKLIKPMLHEETIVIPVVNGIPWWYFQGVEGRFSGDTIQAIDPEGSVSKLLPHPHLIGCVVFITAFRNAPGVVTSTNPHLIVLGEINHEMSDRLEQVRKVIEDAGIEARATDNIRDQIWTKVAANLTSNPLSVVTKGTLEQLYSDQRLKLLVRKILDEVMLVAAAYGARIRFDPYTFMELGAGMGAVKTSMLQDYEANQTLELDAIGYAVLELAEKISIPMPTTKQLLDLTHFVASQPLSNTQS
ncbi:2-dehydropantoate 2-reductase [Marinomonas piezotolerans]|uniref:2-dehydropantoate 2-reductase n=1 Tax=Marinomonas piezotolerans TaxID=2213058 RepID=A0A370UCX2_9GAMM|nr:2-dehydropantoate 2-reductase [Marinomonas piezotolerans]RDL45591.1 2-dehydropantoate 2-reductase [Marinomonas piezotolerans]